MIRISDVPAQEVTVKAKLSIGVLEMRREAKLKQVRGAGPQIQGSLATIRVRCGNPNCRCSRGEKHVSHILNSKVGGRSRSLYVPVDMVEEVRQWLHEQRRVRKLLKDVSELSGQIVRAHVPSRRARARNRAVAAKVAAARPA
jgi:hypothetical protein